MWYLELQVTFMGAFNFLHLESSLFDGRKVSFGVYTVTITLM